MGLAGRDVDDGAMNTAVTGDVDEKPRFFSLSQRIGRLRYFAYTLIAMVACACGLVLVYAVSWAMPVATGKLVATLAFILTKNLLIPMIVFTLGMRRMLDINLNRWWALTVLIPLVTVALFFIPGSKGSNRFGPAPMPNNAGLRFVALAIPIAFVALYSGLYWGKVGADFRQQMKSPDQLQRPGLPGLKSY